MLCCAQVFDYWPQSLSSFARKNRVGLGFLVGRWGTPVPRKVGSSPTFLAAFILPIGSTFLVPFLPIVLPIVLPTVMPIVMPIVMPMVLP